MSLRYESTPQRKFYFILFFIYYVMKIFFIQIYSHHKIYDQKMREKIQIETNFLNGFYL